jgi:hypothetical protein
MQVHVVSSAHPNGVTAVNGALQTFSRFCIRRGVVGFSDHVSSFAWAQRQRQTLTIDIAAVLQAALFMARAVMLPVRQCAIRTRPSQVGFTSTTVRGSVEAMCSDRIRGRNDLIRTLSINVCYFWF